MYVIVVVVVVVARSSLRANRIFGSCEGLILADETRLGRSD